MITLPAVKRARYFRVHNPAKAWQTAKRSPWLCPISPNGRRYPAILVVGPGFEKHGNNQEFDENVGCVLTVLDFDDGGRFSYLKFWRHYTDS